APASGRSPAPFHPVRWIGAPVSPVQWRKAEHQCWEKQLAESVTSPKPPTNYRAPETGCRNCDCHRLGLDESSCSVSHADRGPTATHDGPARPPNRREPLWSWSCRHHLSDWLWLTRAS